MRRPIRFAIAASFTLIIAAGCEIHSSVEAVPESTDQTAPAETPSLPPETGYTAPGSPSGVSATAGNGQAIVSFTSPSSNGGSPVLYYTVTSNPGAQLRLGTASPITVTGLTNGTAYTFTVKAMNSVGTSAPSSPSNSVIPATFPGAPVIGTAIASSGAASISFSPPSQNGGSAITSYTVTSSPENLTATGSSSPLVVTGLTNGTTYTFTVRATNAIGPGSGSNASNRVTPVDVPGAPTIGTAVAGNAQATVSFNAPATNGGSTITSYTVTSNPGSITATGASSPIVVTGLANGTPYTFTVTATNSLGSGPASAASNSITPTITATVPGPPTGVVATPGNSQATVSFNAPASNGGSAITSYTVTSSPGALTATGAASPLTVTGLTNGTAYTFKVTATNIVGTGPASAASSSATPATPPGAPTIGTATAGNGHAVVTFSAPSSNGGSPIIGYTVTSNPPAGFDFNAGSTSTTHTVNGLTNGTSYTFTVTAFNAVGTGSASAASNSIVPLAVPGAPTIGTATRGNGQATISFSAPALAGGAPITSYTVTSSPGSFSASGAASPLTVTGLANGTPYTFTVKATNGQGTGPASAASNSVTPATIPGAPIIGTATLGNTQATVTFSPPVSTGGSRITGYTVTSNPAGGFDFNSGSDATTHTINGLTNGTTYTFTVTATNEIGTGAPSAPSNAITPANVPGAPTIGTASAGNTQATVTFTAPAVTGGSPITSYTVTSTPGSLTATASSSPITITGLTNGVSYTFTVKATNATGTGVPSATSNAVTPSVPAGPPANVADAPVIGSATAGNGQATVTFAAPASNGGSAITSYTVTSDAGHTALGISSPITVAGLTNGTAYTFRVRANNAAGASPASAWSNSVTPATTPGAPTIGTVTAGNGQATVAFAAPVSNGGSPISLYTVTSDVGGFTTTGAASPIIVSGLTNGVSYRFRVKATNGIGTGPLSSASNSVIPISVPGAPVMVGATAEDAQATIAFSAPSSNGGSAITSYTVTSTPGAITKTSTASPITVTGLSNGTAYTFTVKATNDAGTGPISAPSSAVTPALQRPIKVVLGYDHSCAISNTGALKCWGNNKTGKLGDETTQHRADPVTVDPGIRYTNISPGFEHTCGVTSAGVLKCWGNNAHNQLGDGGLEPSLRPKVIDPGTTYLEVAAGIYRSCGITTSGTLKCWGRNKGDLGNGTTEDAPTPTAIDPGVAYWRISTALAEYSWFGGPLTCGITITGVLKCWGRGVVGDGAHTARNTPTVVDPGVAYQEIGTGAGHTCGLTTTGRIKCWGANDFGQLGLAREPWDTKATPGIVGSDYIHLAVGSNHACGLTNTGALECWGSNALGTLGNGLQKDRKSPVAIDLGVTYSTIAAGGAHTCGITTANGLKCWGSNGYGQLGKGILAYKDVPTVVDPGVTYTQVLTPNTSLSTDYSCGITAAGMVNCWGGNDIPKFGYIDTILTQTPTLTSTTAYSQIALGGYHACGITSAGVLKCSGYNMSGQVGRSEYNYTTPVIVDSGVTYRKVTAGFRHTCGITSTGTLKCWGESAWGQLGNEIPVDFYVHHDPTVTDPGVSYAEVAAGFNHTCGITTGGVLKCWGGKSAMPAAVAAGYDVLTPQVIDPGVLYTHISAASVSTCGVTSTGVWKCWGGVWPSLTVMDSGVSYTQVSQSTNFQHCGITTTGALKCKSFSDTTPSVVDPGVNYSYISTATSHSCGITTNGILKCWGENDVGQIGDGSSFSVMPAITSW